MLLAEKERVKEERRKSSEFALKLRQELLAEKERGKEERRQLREFAMKQKQERESITRAIKLGKELESVLDIDNESQKSDSAVLNSAMLQALSPCSRHLGLFTPTAILLFCEQKNKHFVQISDAL